VRGGDHDPVKTLARDRLTQRVAVAATTREPRVDPDTEPQGALLDRFLQTQADAALRRQRRLQRDGQRHARETHRHQHSVLGAGQPQSAVQRVR
jgi:hypothetical protein